MRRNVRWIVLATLLVVAAAGVFLVRDRARLPRIGFLGVDRVAQAPRVAAFVDGLRALGYEDGRNVVIEYRWADGRFDRLPALAQELVAANVDVIVTAAIQPAMAAVRAATHTIPIVIPNMNDPVHMGLVASLAHPDGNITGLAFQDSETGVKRLELLRQIVPGLARLAIVWQRGSGSGPHALEDIENAARAMGLTVGSFEVGSDRDFAQAVAGAKAWGAQAVFQAPAFYGTEDRQRFMQLVAAAKLPAACEGRHFAVDGCLMSYGPSFEEAFRAAAGYVDRILKGARPADLPIDQPREFELVINLKTAQALGIEVPQLLQLQATELLR